MWDDQTAQNDTFIHSNPLLASLCSSNQLTDRDKSSTHWCTSCVLLCIQSWCFDVYYLASHLRCTATPALLLPHQSSVSWTRLVFTTAMYLPPGGGNAWVAFWYAVCSWQVQNNHFTTPMKFPNKPFVVCHSGFIWVGCDCRNSSPILVLFHLLPSLVLTDLTAVLSPWLFPHNPSGSAEYQKLMWEQWTHTTSVPCCEKKHM